MPVQDPDVVQQLMRSCLKISTCQNVLLAQLAAARQSQHDTCLELVAAKNKLHNTRGQLQELEAKHRALLATQAAAVQVKCTLECC